MEKIKVIIVDNDRFYKKYLWKMLEKTNKFELIADLSDGLEFLYEIEDNKPDLVFMAYKMPSMDGIIATKKGCMQCPRIKIIAFLHSNEKELVMKMISAGAKSYIFKDLLEEEDLNSLIKNIFIGLNVTEVQKT